LFKRRAWNEEDRTASLQGKNKDEDNRGRLTCEPFKGGSRIEPILSNKLKRHAISSSGSTPMEILTEQGCFDVLAEQRTSNHFVHLIRKLRWIGMDDEAERVLARLTGCRFRPTETVIAGPWATD
jgi:hypothetical protein